MSRRLPAVLAALPLLSLLSLPAPASAQEKEESAPPPVFSEQDLALIAELVAKLRPDLAAGGDVDPVAASQQLGPYFARAASPELIPRWLSWAKTEFAHPTAGWVGDRTATLVVFGPPKEGELLSPEAAQAGTAAAAASTTR